MQTRVDLMKINVLFSMISLEACCLHIKQTKSDLKFSFIQIKSYLNDNLSRCDQEGGGVTPSSGILKLIRFTLCNN